MDQNEQGTIKDIVKVIYHSRGDWRTPGGIARDLKISPETIIQIVKSHPEFFIFSERRTGEICYPFRWSGRRVTH